MARSSNCACYGYAKRYLRYAKPVSYCFIRSGPCADFLYHCSSVSSLDDASRHAIY